MIGAGGRLPELPEVETVVRLIRPSLEGRTIVGVDVRWTRTLGGLTPAKFQRAVVGARVVRVWRRAKYAVMDLERAGQPAGHLVGHLRMTGRFHVEPAELRESVLGVAKRLVSRYAPAAG
jgi:formamidopyrimidine-DNA glycosylase